MMRNTLRKHFRQQLDTHLGVSRAVGLPYMEPVVTRRWERSFICPMFNPATANRRPQKPKRPSKDFWVKESLKILAVTTV